MLRCKLLQHAQRTFNAQRTLHAQLFPPVENPKRPTRSQNLSERFRRLEKMVLAKHNLNQTITHAPRVPQRPMLSLPTASRHSTPTTFRGLVIPEIPKAPEPDECCMSGCAVCVYDLYQESLDTYKTAVASVRASLTSMGVRVEQWPENIRLDLERKTSPQIILSAFEEMEQKLKAQREAEAQIIATAVHTGSLKEKTARRRRRWRWRRKGVNWGTLYEALRWVLFSNR
ncbi:Oxidoreductase-like protein, N-terminal domain containing protein [Lactarius tabidus]